MAPTTMVTRNAVHTKHFSGDIIGHIFHNHINNCCLFIVYFVSAVSYQRLESNLLHFKNGTFAPPAPQMKGKRGTCFPLPPSPAFLSLMLTNICHKPGQRTKGSCSLFVLRLLSKLPTIKSDPPVRVKSILRQPTINTQIKDFKKVIIHKMILSAMPYSAQWKLNKPNRKR